MKYVLDASVAICWVIRRPLMPKAVRLRDEYQQLFAIDNWSGEAVSGVLIYSGLLAKRT